MEVIRIKNNNREKENENKWIPIKSLKIYIQRQTTGEGNKRSYIILSPWHTFPVPKCSRCLRYGHDYCFYCHGDHPPNTDSCKIHREAQNVNTKNITPNDLEIKKHCKS